MSGGWGLAAMLRAIAKGMRAGGESVKSALMVPLVSSAASALRRQIRQPAFASARDHSSWSHAFFARKLTPTVPNWAALDACGAPAKTSSLQVTSKSTKPAATTVAPSSASSRAPAIQPFQRSMSRLAASGTALVTRMSPI